MVRQRLATPSASLDVVTRSVGRPALVAAGDVVVLASFVVTGLLMHHIPPLSYPVHAALTALPFLIAWALVAPICGAYATRTIRSVKRTIGVTTVAWTIASIVGAGIRATPFFHGGAPVDFVLVNLVFGLGFLLPWRVAVALAARRFGIRS